MKKKLAVFVYSILYLIAFTLIVYGGIAPDKGLVRMGIGLAVCLIPPLLVFLFYKK